MYVRSVEYWIQLPFSMRAAFHFPMDRKCYLSGLGEVIATALPRDYKGKSIRVYVATEEGVNKLATEDLRSANQLSILREIM